MGLNQKDLEFKLLCHEVFFSGYLVLVDTTPRITSSLKRHASTVTMTCSVPEEFEVVRCIFRDPNDYSYMASTSELQTSRLVLLIVVETETMKIVEWGNVFFL